MIPFLRALLVLGLTVVWLPHRVLGQAFQPGYIVQLTGDTLRGELQVRGAMRSARQCTFRPAGASAATSYRPARLRAYGLRQGAAYQARLVPRPDSKVLDTLFIKVLVAGQASLFENRDREDQSRYYLAVGADSLRELRKARVRLPGYNQTGYEEQPLYRSVLAKALRACLAVQPLLPQLPLIDTDLINVVKRYNTCLGGPATTTRPQSPKEQAQLSVGLTGGLDRSKITVSERLTRLHDGNFTATSALFGAFVSFSSPALNRHLALRLDALYQKTRYADSYVARNVSTVEEREQARLDVSYLKLPLQVRYHFTVGRVQPFAFAGGSVSFLLAHDTYLRSESTSAAGTPVVVERVALIENDIARTDYGLLLGAGLATPGLAGHAIGLEARGEFGSGFAESGVRSPIRHLGVLVSVNLTRDK